MNNQEPGIIHVILSRIFHYAKAIVLMIVALFIKRPAPFDIPIIINNRNRLTFLKRLIASLEKRGYSNIIILDNDSDYPPLLDYYRHTPYEVRFLKRNLGFMALKVSGLLKVYRKSYFVYTDPDLEIAEHCPDDFMQYFLDLLSRYPLSEKVGFSLKTDDLPPCYDKRDEVIDFEKLYREKTLPDGNNLAPIDTTFALHRPYSTISLSGTFRNIRTCKPYEMHHLPWYNDSDNLSDEEKYYVDHAHIGGHWTNGDPAYKA